MDGAAGQVRLRRRQGQGRQGHRGGAPGHARRLGRRRRREPVDRRIGLAAGDKVIVDGIAKLQPGRRRSRWAARRRTGAPAAPPARRRQGRRLRQRRKAAPRTAPKSAPRPSPERETPLMFSRFFIDRPIFAAVISMFLVLAGPGRDARRCRSRSTRRSRRRSSPCRRSIRARPPRCSSRPSPRRSRTRSTACRA